jgi:hypothetical protein
MDSGTQRRWIAVFSRETSFAWLMPPPHINFTVLSYGLRFSLPASPYSFFPNRPANGFLEITARYKEIVPKVVMAGPTNFAPAIEMACQIVEQSKQYHILLIVADGQVTNQIHSINAIVKASSLPLSIVLVGVGDGPWDMMEEFDDALPDRQFDNFQFVNFSKVYEDNPKNPDVAFALAALMEIPEQFQVRCRPPTEPCVWPVRISPSPRPPYPLFTSPGDSEVRAYRLINWAMSRNIPEVK